MLEEQTGRVAYIFPEQTGGFQSYLLASVSQADPLWTKISPGRVLRPQSGGKGSAYRELIASRLHMCSVPTLQQFSVLVVGMFTQGTCGWFCCATPTQAAPVC